MNEVLIKFENEIQQGKIVVYGAGKYAKILLLYLKRRRLLDKIDCIVVSNAKNNPADILGIPVLLFSDLNKKMENSAIIIAMAEKNSRNIRKTLNELRVRKILQITGDLHQKFLEYIVQSYFQAELQKNKVFIDCFQGNGYGCNCKYIAEELLKRGTSVDIVWDVTDENIELPKGIKKVVRYSEDFYKELYSSKVWIGNTGIGFFQKREGQYFINTWHGSGPFKKVNAALGADEEFIQRVKRESEMIDLYISNTGDNTEMFRSSFLYNGEILECGNPRNDIFFTDNNLYNDVRKKLGIKRDNKVVLYAPTFRKDYASSFKAYDMNVDLVLDALKKRFGGEFVFLYRFHSVLQKYEQGYNFYDKGINVTLYPDTQELLVAADVLITDYSSVMWDFSLQRKPIFLYQNDEEEYNNDRGFYCPVRFWPYIKAHSTEDMIDKIEKFDEADYISNVNDFIDKYKSFDDGHASETVVDRILDIINS